MVGVHARFSAVASEDGFTVFEFVAAALILFVVLMGILASVEYAGASSRMAAIREDAINVATNQIETARNLPYDNLGVVYPNGWVGDPAGTIPATQTVTTAVGSYTVATTVWWARDYSTPSAPKVSTKNLRVTVSWTTPMAGSVAVETSVFGVTTTGNTGMVVIHAANVDSPSTPVAGVSAVLDPISGVNRIATTGVDGTFVWNNVPVGSAGFPDPDQYGNNAASGWLVDMSAVGTQTIKAGYQDLGYVYCQKACTARIHVHSTSLPNYPGATVTLKDTDRNITYTAVTGSDGYATFSAAANTVNGTAGLWKSKSGGYSAVAATGSVVSTAGTFLMASSAENYSGLDLALPDPPTIQVSLKVSTTGVALTGVPWTCSVTDPSGNVVGTYSGTNPSFSFAVTKAGSYTAIVTGVPGFQNNTGYTQTFNTTGVNQPFVVPMFPLFSVGVMMGSSQTPLSSAKVTVSNAVSGVVVTSTAGVSPGVTGTNGIVSFGIPADGNYNVSAVVNGVTYTGSQQTLYAASPPTQVDTITVPACTLSVGVKTPSTSGWWRYVAVWNAASSLVATAQVYSVSGQSTTQYATFTLPPGGYYVCAGGGTSHTTPPSTPPQSPSSGGTWSGNTASPYLPPPVTTLPTSGGTVSIGPISGLN